MKTTDTSALTAAGGARGRIAVVAATFIGLAAGIPSSYFATATTFIAPLTSAFGWGRMVPTLMYVASMGAATLSSFWLGAVIERFGAARVALVSGLCLAGALMALGMQTGAPAFAFAICFLAGALGAGTGVGLYLSVLPKWFDRDLGRALGLSIVGMSVGVTLMPALAASLSMKYGWRSAYFTLAGVEIALTLLAVGLLMWSSRQGQGQGHAVRDGEASSDQNGASLREAVRTPTFWIIAAMVFLGTSGVFGASFQVLPRYADLGVAGAVIPVIAAMAGLGTLVGRLSSGFLLDYIDARSIACVTLGIGATGIFGLAMMGQGQSTLIVCLPPLLLGAALGAESDILPYMVRRYFGPRQFALIYNRLLIAFQSGAVVGPLALSLAFDRFSQMEGALVAIGACCLVAAVLAVLLPPPAGRTWVAQNARDLPTR